MKPRSRRRRLSPSLRSVAVDHRLRVTWPGHVRRMPPAVAVPRLAPRIRRRAKEELGSAAVQNHSRLRRSLAKRLLPVGPPKRHPLRVGRLELRLRLRSCPPRSAESPSLPLSPPLLSPPQAPSLDLSYTPSQTASKSDHPFQSYSTFNKNSASFLGFGARRRPP